MEDDMTRDKKMIKKDILDKFRSIDAEDSHVLPPNWLDTDYFESLNWEEKVVFKKAVQELISKGIVESVQDSRLNLRLTKKGADLIYCCQ
jgi:hypothetical protein